MNRGNEQRRRAVPTAALQCASPSHAVYQAYLETGKCLPDLRGALRSTGEVACRVNLGDLGAGPSRTFAVSTAVAAWKPTSTAQGCAVDINPSRLAAWWLDR